MEMKRSNLFCFTKRPTAIKVSGPSMRGEAGLNRSESTTFGRKYSRDGGTPRAVAYRMASCEFAARVAGRRKLIQPPIRPLAFTSLVPSLRMACLLYTSDAADE